VGDQVLIKILPRTTGHSLRVGARTPMTQEKHLLLRRRHLIVTVILTQIRLLILQPTHRFFVRVSTLNVDNTNCLTVNIDG